MATEAPQAVPEPMAAERHELLLLPTVRRSVPARIVNVASIYLLRDEKLEAGGL